MAKVQLLGDKASGYQLTLDGEPFFIKGAGLEFGHLQSLAEAGGNTFRTWRVANGERDAIDILDEAEALGLKVCMGLDIARERHGFDYSDQAAVIAQNEAMMRDVIRLKDHPALLMWGLGNELKKKYWFISLKLSTKTGRDRTIRWNQRNTGVFIERIVQANPHCRSSCKTRSRLVVSGSWLMWHSAIS